MRHDPELLRRSIEGRRPSDRDLPDHIQLPLFHRVRAVEHDHLPRQPQRVLVGRAQAKQRSATGQRATGHQIGQPLLGHHWKQGGELGAHAKGEGRGGCLEYRVVRILWGAIVQAGDRSKGRRTQLGQIILELGSRHSAPLVQGAQGPAVVGDIDLHGERHGLDGLRLPHRRRSQPLAETEGYDVVVGVGQTPRHPRAQQRGHDLEAGVAPGEGHELVVHHLGVVDLLGHQGALEGHAAPRLAALLALEAAPPRRCAQAEHHIAILELLHHPALPPLSRRPLDILVETHIQPLGTQPIGERSDLDLVVCALVCVADEHRPLGQPRLLAPILQWSHEPVCDPWPRDGTGMPDLRRAPRPGPPGPGFHAQRRAQRPTRAESLVATQTMPTRAIRVRNAPVRAPG